jgi:uncharacterized protein YbjT (DUF2867 family)
MALLVCSAAPQDGLVPDVAHPLTLAVPPADYARTMSTHLGRVAVIGAHGKVARLLVPLLREQGYDVSGLVRSESHLPELAERGADGVLLDVEHATEDEIADALVDHAAVVWSAGAGGGNPARTYAVDRDAAIRSMAAAERVGVARYVMVSWAGSSADHGVPEDHAFFPYADAKLAADDHLRGTGLDWTILGPGALTDEPATGAIDLEPPYGQVSRGTVAQVVAAALRIPETSRRFIPFADGSTPIEDALLGGSRLTGS